jgi:dipicolinate synthase subunit A
MKDFIFLGGDLRFIYAAAKLNKDYDCSVYGFDTLDDEVFRESGVPILSRIKRCKSVVLPLPVSRNCDYITAPYCSERIPLSAVVDACAENGTIYCGKACPALRDISREKSITLIDYFEREELIVLNAVVTAEGAIEIIMRERARSIMGMNVLVTGYGRIAKVLSGYLRALGANVTVCARKFSDLAWARINGCAAVHINDVDEILCELDTVVNTVPAQIFDRSRLVRLRDDCLIVDLASKTGIEDMELAKDVGVKVIWALSIPGKVAPITAGEIIADTILNIIAEQVGTAS